ncbi:hypothetical protein [Verrucomicrobium sp. BvORR034]|uniref:hypothetical protein n=1 Tax=Verrucomicrobium sp. BvORR034 TaxID=1396418 RepID=UPI0006787A5A|nr:hypothetical protein [Verrucomicrobium sp. BvORR034]
MNSLAVGSLWSALAICSLSLGGNAFAQEALPAKLEKAESAYFHDQDIARKNYRKALAAALDDAVRAEIYLLDFETVALPKKSDDLFASTPPIPADTFVIAPYQATSKILKRRLIKGADLAKLLPHLKQTVGVEENTSGAMCHFPIHGIRVWDKDYRILFESSFCYKCSNFFITYPNYRDGSPQWTGLTEKEFEQVMIELMPIPQSELDRFDAKFGGGKKGKPKEEKKKQE